MSSQQPKTLTDQASRQQARHIRDNQWRKLERIAEQDPHPLYICWWNKNRHHNRDVSPPDLLVCGLIDGMEMLHWLKAHPEWVVIGEWSDERYAAPVHITDSGLDALSKRERYDLEPVVGGLVEPGWQAIPMSGDDT